MRKHFGWWPALMLALAVGAGPATTQSSNASAEEALEKTLPEFRTQNASLDACAAKFKDLTGVNFVIDWPALEAAGVTKQQVMSTALKNLTVSTTISVIARAFSPAKAPLGYDIVNNTIVISTQKRLDSKMTQVNYDVAWFFQQTGGNDSSKKQLIQTIETTIAPTTWKSHGGTGVIRFFGKSLVVTNAPRVQRQIPALLEKLKEAAEKK